MTKINFWLGVAGSFFGAWVFMFVWNWMPAQIFEIKQIGYAEAWGLYLFTAFFKNVKYDKKKRTEAEELERVFFMFFYMSFIWLIAFIVQFFI